jgi:nicotinamide-nucleotide amidase
MNLRITIRDGNEDHAREVLENTEETIRQRLGHQVFAVDEETHSQVVGALLRQKNLTLASAESCTGGLLGGSVTAEAGSSDYFLGGVVSYANSAKEGLLGVKDLSLIQYGAVSKEVAEEMAEGARKVFGADLGISTTGIAGPGGATPEKPVGLVYIALAHRDGCIVEKKQFAGNRDSVRNMTVEAAMNMLRIFLLSKE